MSTNLTYGIGGYDPNHPSGNVVEEVVDNEDGTGTRTTYDPDGNVTSTEELTNLPIPIPLEPTPEERLAQLESRVNAVAPVPVEHPDVEVQVDDALQQEVASLRATVEALTIALDEAKVIIAADIKSTADAATSEKELLLKVAERLGTGVEEALRIRDEYPDKWTTILAELGLDEVGTSLTALFKQLSKLSGMTVEELAKIREREPERWREMLAKYELSDVDTGKDSGEGLVEVKL